MGTTRKLDDTNVLQRIRRGRKLSQCGLAALVKVSRTMVSGWECRTREITLSQLDELKKAMRLSEREVDEIVTWWGAAGGKRPRSAPRPDQEEAHG